MDLVIVTEGLGSTAYVQMSMALGEYLANSLNTSIYILSITRPYGGLTFSVGKASFIGWSNPENASKNIEYFLRIKQPNIVLTINDAFVNLPIFQLKEQLKFKLIGLAIEDGYPLRCPDSKFFYRHYDYLIGLTRWATENLKRHGFRAVYLPSFVNTKVFHPIPKEEVRTPNIRNSFVVQYVGTNILRKNIPALLEAFAKGFKDKEALLWLHCQKYSYYGFPLPDLVNQFDIKSKVLFTPHLDYLNYPQEALVKIYNLADVHASTTTGEAFGLTHVESMACGIPQVYTDYASLPEVIGDKAGIPVRADNYYLDYRGVRRALVNVDDFKEALLYLYENPKIREEMAHCAIEKSKEYSHDTVLPMWKSFLEGML